MRRTRAHTPSPWAKLILDTLAEQGRSKRRLAELLGTHEGYLGRMLNGTGEPFLRHWFIRSADLLGIPRNIVEDYLRRDAA